MFFEALREVLEVCDIVRDVKLSLVRGRGVGTDWIRWVAFDFFPSQ